MIRFTRLYLRASSGTTAERHALLFLYLCRIEFPPTRVAGTFTELACPPRPVLRRSPRWMPRPASRTFAMKQWPYGDVLS
jgi:hypothetical protein